MLNVVVGILGRYLTAVLLFSISVLLLSLSVALKIAEDRPTNYPDKLASRDRGFSIRDTLPILQERLEVSVLEPIFRPPR